VLLEHLKILCIPNNLTKAATCIMPQYSKTQWFRISIWWHNTKLH